MCEPTTLLAIGNAVAGSSAVAGSAAAAGTMATGMQALSAGGKVIGGLAGVAAQNKAAAQNAQSAKDAYFLKSKQSNLRILQEQTQASMQKQDADLKALKSQGTAMAAAGGAGVQGANVDQLINDFERSEGVMADRIQQKLESMQAQNEVNKLGYQTEAQNRINSMQPVGFAETLFKVAEPIAGFGLDYYDSKSRLAAETE
ncbi:hypothetical protein CRP114_gp38 [Roseobacter phage CRP-114]|uniref:Internal virion protein n=1 Tax=Roseobacter phage CRP-114 TaxID=3072842 RepID=A0AAX3ZVP5_9CAUD|nr:hypothetical protein CRP114_gp38 [Roseobacter phage CRP-114]